MNNHNRYTIIEVLVGLAAIASLAVGIFAAWVMWHFIEMYW